jgi:hypothetical protein
VAVSGASVLETPVGSLAVVADDLRREILGLSHKFTVMEQGVDEREHSGETQYPYLAQTLKAAATSNASYTSKIYSSSSSSNKNRMEALSYPSCVDPCRQSRNKSLARCWLT